MDPTPLFNKAREYLPPDKLAIVEAAYDFALKSHDGQKRKSGTPFLEHPLQTAIALADLQLDAATLAAALLHDVPEDCNIPISELEKRFGPDVSKLVDGVTKLSKLAWKRDVAVSSRETQAENLRKMLIAMAEDLRVVFIKLADRLHNMNTLQALAPERRLAIAQETLEIYAPWRTAWVCGRSNGSLKICLSASFSQSNTTRSPAWLRSGAHCAKGLSMTPPASCATRWS